MLHQVTTYELYYKYAKTVHYTHMQLFTVTTQTADAQNVNKFVLLSLHKNAFENFESRISDLVYDDMFWIILIDGPNFPSQKVHNRQSVVVKLIRRMHMIK